MTDEIEKKNIYYPSGKLRLEILYKKGKPQGTSHEWHENGVLASERNFKDGIPHGLHREWYENGNLASERNFKEGIPDGISRYWDENGKLIVENNIVNGNGVEKNWEPVNRTWGEHNWVNGTWTGRSRVCWEDGTVVKDEYWIKNRKVSKKKYIEMCELDDTLPQYDDLFKSKKSKKKSKKKDTPTEYDYFEDEAFYTKLFSENQMVDALRWLTEPDVPERTVGECTRPEDSIELVKDFYILGAVKVWTFDIDGKPDEEQNSGKLVIELPDNSKKRKKILDKCNEIAEKQGYDPVPDISQKYTLVMLD